LPRLWQLQAIVTKITFGLNQKYSVSQEFASEVVLGIRTVRASNQERDFTRIFRSLDLAVTMGNIRLIPKLTGIGVLMFVLNMVVDIASLCLGAFLVDNYSYTVVNIMAANGALVSISGAFGIVMSSATPYTNGRLAAEEILNVVDRKSKIDGVEPTGLRMTLGSGIIEFTNVCFSFPHAPAELVLKSVEFRIDKGQHLALLGPSGCGKSSTVQLLVRFYDPVEGSLHIGGWDLKEFNVAW